MLNFFKKINFYYATSLLFLVLLSFLFFFKSQDGNCTFLSNWPFCTGLANGDYNKLIISTICFSLLFLVLIIFNFFSNKIIFESQNRKLFTCSLLLFIVICAFLILPFTSIDSVFYFNAGRVITEGVNPYTTSWQVINDYSASVGVISKGLMYGPLTAFLFLFFYLISFSNYWIFIILWKVLIFAGLVLVGLLVKNIASILNIKINNETYWLYWLSSPILLFEWLINGHFDGLWLVFVLLAILFSIKNKWILVLPMLTIGIWIKFIPLLMLPWFMLWWWQQVDLKNKFKMFGQISLGVLISIIITLASWLFFWQGFKVFIPIVVQSKWAVNSSFSVIYYSFKPLAISVFGSNAHYFLTRIVQSALLLIAIYFIWPYIKKFILVLLKKNKMEAMDYVQAIFITLLAYLVIWQKSFWPWYFAWLLPLGLMVFLKNKNKYLQKILFYITSTPFLFYVFQLWQESGASELLFNWYVFLFIIAPALYFLFKWRRVNYDI